MNLFKNEKGVLTANALRSFFEKETKNTDEELVTAEELGMLYDMISTVDGKITQDIDLKKMKEFSRALELDAEDKYIALMHKMARNPDTGKLSREDLMKLGKAFQKSKDILI